MVRECSGGGWTEDTQTKTQVCHLKEGSDGNNVGLGSKSTKIVDNTREEDETKTREGRNKRIQMW
jgi:hypothetical protein